MCVNLQKNQEIHKEIQTGVQDQQLEQQQANLQQQAVPLVQVNQAAEQHNIIDPDQDMVLGDWVRVFTSDKTSGRSDEFNVVKDLLKRNNPLLMQIDEKKINLGSANYNNFMKMYEALNAYARDHANASQSKGKERYKAAMRIKQALDLAALRTAGIQNDGLDHQPVEATALEKKAAEENVNSLMRYYRKYSQKIGEDMLSSYEDKLIARWNVMKTCERDIRIYMTMHQDEGAFLYGDKAFFIEEYKSLRAQIQLINYRKQQHPEQDAENKRSAMVKGHARSMMKEGLSGQKKAKAQDQAQDQAQAQAQDQAQAQAQDQARPAEQEKIKLEYTDEGLKKEQLDGLVQIDQWVLRNIQNGGYMTFGLNISDRTDFATKLLNLSKRERLYVYYLVEKRERINPTGEGIITSQDTYVPDLSMFKKHMVASKLKFYSRFSGGYIYWHKLAEAMSIANQAKVPLAFMEATQAILKEKDKQGDEKEKEQEEAKNNSKQLAKNVEEDLKKKKGMEAVKAGDVAQYGMGLPMQLKGLLGLPGAVTNDMTGIGMTEIMMGPAGTRMVISNDFLRAFEGYLNQTGFGLMGAASLLGGIMSAIQLASDKTMTALDTTATAVSLAGSVGGVVNSANMLAILNGNINSATKFLSATPVSLGISGVNLLAGIAKTASYLSNGRERVKASRMISKKNGNQPGDKFEEGMLRLNRKLGAAQRTDALNTLINGGAMMTAGVLVATSVCTMGLTAIVGGITFGVGIAAQILTKKYKGGMKDELFDTFYEVDTVFKKAVKDYEREHECEMNDDQKSKLREQVRRHIAAELGFNSPRHAAKAVAGIYAEYMLKNARSDADEEKQKQFITLIQGLGLKWKPDAKPPVPGIPDIIKKMVS